MSTASKLLQVNAVKQDIKDAIEDKGVDLSGVAFTDYAEKIGLIEGGGGGEVVEQSFAEKFVEVISEITQPDYYETYAGMIYDNGEVSKTTFDAAWEHSLTVDPSEISVSSLFSSRGKDQYPNGETEGVIIPHSVTSIGSSAFYGWQSNTHPLVIPNSVTSIGGSAFYNWTSNNQPLVIPDSVTSIGESAFSYWRANNHPLVIPDSVTSIGSYAFRNWEANNQPLVIPDSVTSIGANAFSYWNSNNQPLVIPDSVTSIGSYAFRNWEANNQPLVIPDSVTSIGNDAFRNWSSNNQPLVIPDGVTSIGENAFRDWELVPYIEMKSETPPTLSNSNAFNNQNNAPIYVPDESVDDYKTATNWVNLASRIFSINDK